MKQTMKRFYGTIILIALVSGLTGAFASTWIKGRAAKSVEPQTGMTAGVDDFMQVNDDITTPPQHIDLTQAAEKACNAVVYIKVTMGGQTVTRDYYDDSFGDIFEYFFGRGQGGGRRPQQVQTPKRQASGSGVIISRDGYIVTNNHVVENANEIEVTLNDNREFKATVIGTDPSTDLALLKVEGSDLPTLVVGNSDALKVGEWVLAVGNPFNLKSTVTAGIVSAKARKIDDRMAKGNEIESFIQTDAAINAGNSGGALVNARGELVGINAALYSQTGSFTGYGFAIPTTIMQKVVSDLKQFGVVQRAMLGISGSDLTNYIESMKQQDENFNKDFGTNDGVYVAEVSPEGAAHDAGIESGDVIVGVAGRKITKMSELQETLSNYSPGDKVSVEYIRDKKTKIATVELKNNQGNTKIVKQTGLATSLGAKFTAITDDQKKTLNMKNGVQVTEISQDSPLRNVGMGNEFIILNANNQTITSVADLEKVFKLAQQSEQKVLFIWGKYPSGRTGSYAVELE